MIKPQSQRIPSPLSVLSAVVTLSALAATADPISDAELRAPRIEWSASEVYITYDPTVIGRRYQLQFSETMRSDDWRNFGSVLTGSGGPLGITIPRDAAIQSCFYRIELDPSPVPLGSMVLIPGGGFQMGDARGETSSDPVRFVYVSPFLIQNTETTKEEWDMVRTWGSANGYTDLVVGQSKGPNHPVQATNLSWYQVVKWCNARSQMEGLTPCYTVSGAVYKTANSIPDCNWAANGYRLPTQAEWEKAARGGLTGKRFPLGDTISHSQANYFSTTVSYDLSPSDGYHPVYNDGEEPYTAPVGSFAPNGFGLYEMTGNVSERCWDWHSTTYFNSQPDTDPRGPSTGDRKISRGGHYQVVTFNNNVAFRLEHILPTHSTIRNGFRPVRGVTP